MDRFETPARPGIEFGDERPNKAVGARSIKTSPWRQLGEGTVPAQ